MALLDPHNRFSEFVKRTLGLTGPGVLEQVISDVMPVIVVNPPEVELYSRWFGLTYCSTGIGGVAVAGQLSRVWLQNPLGSGVVVVPLACECNVSVACSITVAGPQNGSRAGTPGYVLDGRDYISDSNSRSRAVVAAENTVGTSLTRLASQISCPVTTWTPVLAGMGAPMVLAPGQAVGFETTAVNVQLGAYLRWYERVLDQSEDS